MLRDIHCQNQNIFLCVDTTCPLPRSERPMTPAMTTRTFEPPPTIPEQDNDDDVIIDMDHEHGRDHRDRRDHHRRDHR
jgi:hypothetical protein